MVSPDPHAHHEQAGEGYVSEMGRHTVLLQNGQDEPAPLDEGEGISNESVNHIFHALHPGKGNERKSVKDSLTVVFHLYEYLELAIVIFWVAGLFYFWLWLYHCRYPCLVWLEISVIRVLSPLLVAVVGVTSTEIDVLFPCQ